MPRASLPRHHDVKAPFGQALRGCERIAAIIARSRQHQHGTAIGEARSLPRDGLPRPLHQRLLTASAIEPGLFGGAHRVDGQDRCVARH
jgi:hypothetical protein